MSKFLPLWPDSASTMSGQVDALYIYLLAGCRRHEPRSSLSRSRCSRLSIVVVPGREATQIEGSTILEITWSIIPFFVMLTFSSIWGAVLYFQERTSARHATEVYVVAKQWMWKIEPTWKGQREINELQRPRGAERQG